MGCPVSSTTRPVARFAIPAGADASAISARSIGSRDVSCGSYGAVARDGACTAGRRGGAKAARATVPPGARNPSTACRARIAPCSTEGAARHKRLRAAAGIIARGFGSEVRAMDDVTRCLDEWRQGDETVLPKLLALLYDEMRGLAERQL